MKKERIISLMLALFATATAVRAQALVQINSSTFPDANFRNIVKGKDIDKDQDGMLSTAERLAVTTLTVSSKSIESLKGVEHFFKLTQLNCEDNRLSSLDVSKITTLKTLYCSENRLTSLDVSKNTELTALYCYSNKLTSLDLSNNKALTALTCYLNQIGHSDMLKLVNSLPTVTKGNFYGICISSSSEKNVLAKSSVEIAQSKGWNVLARDGSSPVAYAGSDYLIDINSTNFPDENFRAIVAGTDIDEDADGKLSEEEIAAVTKLKVFSKNIASLKGIEFFTALTELYCYGNQLTSLDVSKNTALKVLACFNNQIKEDQMQALVNSLPTVTEGYFYVIDTKNSNEQNVCTKDQVAIAKGKGWTVYDYNGGSQKEYAGSGDLIAIDATNFPDASFRAVVAGTDIDKDADGKLSEEEIAAVTQLNVSEKNIASLKGIEFFTALTELYCYGNQLTSLDVSKNTALKYLYCNTNQLTSLDVSKNTALAVLACENNQLTSLDVSKNKALFGLGCDNNQLTSLDVSKNTALKDLWCYGNQLTSLDVSKNTALTFLACFNNQIKGDKMQALVNSLPTVTGGKFWVIDTKNNNEQNVCTKPQVKIATDKGWKVYDYNGDGSGQEYTGSVVTAIRSIEVSPETKSHWYTLDGKRLSSKPAQKGIYVRNGRKVVVK